MSWLKWLTPLGWAHLTRPVEDERWAVVLLPVLLTAALIGVAYAVVARRDFGAVLLPARLGPARGRISGSLGLAWRLQRGLLLCWTGAFAVAGLFFGGLAAAVRGSTVTTSSPLMQEFVRRYTGSTTAGLDDAFLWVIALTLGYTAALYPALAVLRLRAEEDSGRAELLLAAPDNRLRWVGGHLLHATIGTVLVLAAGGVSAGLVYAAATADAAQLPRILAGALIQVPAAWVLGAVTVLAFGVLPGAAAGVAWSGFLVIQLFEVLGPVAGIDFAFVEVVIPFWHLPRILAGGELALAPLLILVTLSAGPVMAGLVGLRRRDVAR